ncbi:hypothetical protein HB847_02955 [Listeria booriae]|uniref:HTH crp-type domain-containing protein n=1 Tax=Listeria booriae TaxID=1552123 RepID=A0A841Y503_9LIST|nr:hypothetical protein [Listeria booriae]MBC1371315.1 hypothetical protein [Listeria booriae]MBC2675951.1 hypothetical protein [Listeria booriae]
MDFLTIHNLLPREPNLLLSLIDTSISGNRDPVPYHVKKLSNHQRLILSDSGKIINIVKGYLLQQVNNNKQNKQLINAIWVEGDFIFHNMFHQDCYDYLALGDVELEIYDGEFLMKEIAVHSFFSDLLIDALKQQEFHFYRYFHMLTKSARERIIDTIKLLSTKKCTEGYHIPSKVNYLLLSKCCQISPHTAKKVMQELEQELKIIIKKDQAILLYD